MYRGTKRDRAFSSFAANCLLGIMAGVSVGVVSCSQDPAFQEKQMMAEQGTGSGDAVPVEPIDPTVIDTIDTNGTTPVSPIDPVNPIDPVSPIDPVNPIDPVTPTPVPTVVPTPVPTIDPGTEPGINTVPVTQHAIQAPAGKVDILWVVDNSGSMKEEQTYLGQNFQAFMNNLNAAKVDFQIAVTNTDACDDVNPAELSQRKCPIDYGGTTATHLRGSFVGTNGRKVLKKGDVDLVSRFASYTALGVDGSGFEHGLASAQMAVEKVMSGVNEDLIRPDAFLAVFVVSDEEDDGIGLSMKDAYNGYNFLSLGMTTYRYTDDDLIGYLAGIKGAGKFGVSTITGTRLSNGKMCSAPHSQPLEEGTQYIKAATRTGGIVQSICDTNWNTSLAQMGLDLSAQITQIVLDKIPISGTIAVTVNDVATTQWDYIPASNALRFRAGAVPEPGARITIDYKTLK